MTLLKLTVEHLTQPNTSLLILTGAGVSVASGLPTFRGPEPDAVWSRDTTEKGTRAYFQRDPVGSWRWYLPRFEACGAVQPNPGHIAITRIETALLGAGRSCLTVTQNIDGLHVAAGTQNLLEIHGAARKMRCSNRKCEHGEPKGVLPWDDTLFDAFRAEPTMQALPRCPRCRKLLRAHVLWFDERYDGHEDYGMRRFERECRSISCILIAGTSFSVGITDRVLALAEEQGVPAFVVDPGLQVLPLDTKGLVLIRERSEVFLPALADALERAPRASD